MREVVAIDGPAGAGKTTVAKAVADALGWRYLDTGAMYRAVTALMLDRGFDPGNEEYAEEVASGMKLFLQGDRILVNGSDMTRRIRHQDVTDAVPVVAAHPRVREQLLGLQRRFADEGKAVIEGRDISAVVVPDAAVKVFLTASGAVRAARRGEQLGLPGDDTTVALIESELSERDRLDSSRDVSPLTQVDEAVVLDSSERSVEEIVAEIVTLVKKLRP